MQHTLPAPGLRHWHKMLARVALRSARCSHQRVRGGRFQWRGHVAAQPRTSVARVPGAARGLHRTCPVRCFSSGSAPTAPTGGRDESVDMDAVREAFSAMSDDSEDDDVDADEDGLVGGGDVAAAEQALGMVQSGKRGQQGSNPPDPGTRAAMEAENHVVQVRWPSVCPAIRCAYVCVFMPLCACV